MIESPKLRLVLFFTRGVSLQTWEQVGSFEREVALYRQLQAHGIQVTFVTYGDAQDLRYADCIPGITILCNRWRLPGRIYQKLLPFLYGAWFRKCDVIKTNQTNGADIALEVARLWRKPLIARCGYMWSDLAAHSGPERGAEVNQARSIETNVFGAATQVVVTTPAMRDYTLQHYHLHSTKVQVIPNYILTDHFVPQYTSQIPNQLCFIGRLSFEKNPLALVEACAGLDVVLVMVGDGPLRQEIAHLARQLGVKLKLIGNMPHLKLTEILHQSALFLLVSPHEGHPKTLLEAMACGLPVIGANSPGIRELIQHEQTGWLCGTDADSIRQAIGELLARPQLRTELGENARRFVVEHFALNKIVQMELSLLQKTLTG